MAAPTWYSPADQLIYKDNQFIPQEQYRSAPYPNIHEDEEVTQGSGIPYTNAFTQSGGSSNYTGSASNLIGDFNTAITDRQAKLNEMNRPMRPERRTANYNQPGQGVFTPAEQPTFKRSIQDFIYDKVPYINRPQSYKDIMTKGYQEPEGPGLPTIFNFMNKMGIQNFASLPQSDQAFIKSQTGYTGPTVFGENTTGLAKDPFGKNVESLFGNYAEGVRKDYDKLSKHLGSKTLDKHGAEWDEEKGMFTGPKAQKWNDLNKLNITRYNFRKNQINKQGDILHESQFPKPDGTTTGGDGPTPSSINIQKQAIGMPEHLTQGGGQPHGTDTSGEFAGKGTGNPFNRADGGRVGFQEGGWSPGVGRDESGYLFDHGGGDGSQPNDNIVIPPKDNLTVDTDLISKEPSMELMYSPSELAKIRARIFNKDITSQDDINLEGQISGEKGLFDYVGNFSDQGWRGTDIGVGPFRTHIDPHKNIDLSFAKNIGGLDINARTNLKDATSLSASKNGWYGGINYNPYSGASGQVGWKKTWGGEPKNYNTLSYQDNNPDLIYGMEGQNLRYGGLVSIL